jgi:8-hydroxy-5-deazaflavin:NADPH oxidoreductase
VRVAVVGRGRVGGGLGDRWEQAGHEVTRIGRDGGDVSGADAVLMAVPGGAVAAAFETVTGWDGKSVIDATNLVGTEPPEGFASNAEFIKSRTRGPTAKSFNVNFMSLLGALGEARAKPGNLWCGDEEAAETVEQLIRDAGYEPLHAGGLENASTQEATVKLWFAISGSGMGPFLYRMAPADQL